MEADSDATGGSEIIYYSVYQGAVEVANEVPLVQTSDNSYLFSIDLAAAGQDSEQFRVAASNIYGEGAKSDPSEAIAFGSVPDKLTALKSSNPDAATATNGVITWDPPTEDNLTIKIEILDKTTTAYKNADTIMNALPAGGALLHGRQFDCNKLISEFGYQSGDTVVFRVMAENTIGESEWAYPTLANMEATTFLMLLI